MLDYRQFMILESFSRINESASGFGAIKDADDAEKATEKYKKQLDEAKEKMKDISPSKVISYCYGKLKAGEKNNIKKEMPFIDEVKAEEEEVGESSPRNRKTYKEDEELGENGGIKENGEIKLNGIEKQDADIGDGNGNEKLSTVADTIVDNDDKMKQLDDVI